MLQYIDENLNRIIQNPDSVMYLRPYDIYLNKQSKITSFFLNPLKNPTSQNAVLALLL